MSLADRSTSLLHRRCNLLGPLCNFPSEQATIFWATESFMWRCTRMSGEESVGALADRARIARLQMTYMVALVAPHSLPSGLSGVQLLVETVEKWCLTAMIGAYRVEYD